MRFFELTSSNGNAAHVPVDQFLRIETFDDYQAGNGIVQVLFRNETTTPAEVTAKELEFILALKSNDLANRLQSLAANQKICYLNGPFAAGQKVKVDLSVS
jgi:hypothetical protein